MSNDDVIFYKQLPDGYYVGNNEEIIKNSLQPNAVAPSKLVIPYQHNSIPVDYIGMYAFYQCQEIIEVKIEARLKAINYCAFFGCQNLKYINIPSTCRSLGGSALDGRLDPTDILGTGPLAIIFEPYSTLNYFGQAAISNFKKITIYIFNEISATCDKYFLFNVPPSDLKIYSKSSFNICGFSTSHFPSRIQSCNICFHLHFSTFTSLFLMFKIS